MSTTIEDVRTFLDLAVAREHRVMVAEGVPASMRVGEVDEDGWVEWRPTRSEVSIEELTRLESTLGATLPPAYRALLLDRHFVELHRRIIDFHPHRARVWKRDFQRRLRIYGNPDERKLVPIGHEPKCDAGTIYLDLRHVDADGDGPVVCHDHGWIGTEHEWRTFFSSSRRMFRALTEVLVRPPEHDPWFHRGEPSDEERRAKVECLRAFFAADPEGAGGSSRAWFAGLALVDV